MLPLYRLALVCYGLAIRIAALFSDKAAAWVAGRNDWQHQHRLLQAEGRRTNAPLLWMHCASLGEFEQGRPILEYLRAKDADIQILLTFFSPSGYQLRRDYEHADFVVYLPLDQPRAARAFVHIWQPAVAVFVKYEFWYYHFRALHRVGVPIFLAAGLFRADQVFFRWYGGLFRRLLGWVAHCYVQDERSVQLLRSIGVHRATACGDPRVDRVVTIAQTQKKFPLIQAFTQGQSILMVGSNWPADDAVLLPLLNRHWPPGWKAIIAPHNINDVQMEGFRERLSLTSVRYSQATAQGISEAQVLIIDNIGMLSALYRYGTIAYIGGAFRTGLHNTLEPIAFGLPVLFGPRYRKFEEARYLVETGGAVSVKDAEELREAFTHWLEEEARAQAAEAARRYVRDNQGASAVIGVRLLELINDPPLTTK